MRKGRKQERSKSISPWQNLGLRMGSVALAILLWFFVVSENEYSVVMSMPIEGRNLPAQKALKEEVPAAAQVRLKGTGRALFKTFLMKNFMSDFKLVLDLERISEEYDFILNDYFERYPQKVVIPSSFDVQYVEVIYPDSVHISLDVYKEKIVPVRPDIVLEPAPGFVLVGDPVLEPLSVIIAGSRDIVEQVSEVWTEPDTVLNAEMDVHRVLRLKVLKGQLVEYTPPTVTYDQSVQAISERIISEIPVQILHPRSDLQAFVSPQTVSLTVTGGVDFIAALRPEDITISVDFNDWNPRQQFYNVQVQVPPDVLDWMDLSPKNVELVVTKRVG
jgi:YbbR domain-containing protein